MDGYRGPVTATEGMKWLFLLRLLEQCLKSWFTIIIDRPVIGSDLETLSGDALFGRLLLLSFIALECFCFVY